MARTVWHEVIERRHLMHKQAGPESMETWAPADIAWVGLLEDAEGDVVDARTDASGGHGDPREALIDLLAVASAWVDAFDQRQQVG